MPVTCSASLVRARTNRVCLTVAAVDAVVAIYHVGAIAVAVLVSGHLGDRSR
jgi:hypothetical protein